MRRITILIPLILVAAGCTQGAAPSTDPSADPQAVWTIKEFGGNFVIVHAGSFNGEYLYASEKNFSSRRFIYTHKTKAPPKADDRALWTIKPLQDDDDY